ncbi:Alpha/Beta hydrolase protein [Tribonema minus]|uniref:Alpha/Beta hydrolase protein n=1 Tax=Tribonema minus TaxID=303371 RepID=A0A835Z0G5_9STRA|nr:Alpha/Beta hydrolase protein [Tribonema minus]
MNPKWRLGALLALCVAVLVSWRGSGQLTVLSWLASITDRLLGIGGMSTYDPQQIAERKQRVEAILSGVRGKPMHRVEDMTFPGSDGFAVPVRIYHPNATAASLGEPLPAIIYLHGGGWVFGSVDAFDSVARALAAAANSIVLSVGYRQPPAHPFPRALEDAAAALRWARRGGARALGADAARVALVGDSAGGNLAAAAALAAAGGRVAEGFRQLSGRRRALCAVVLGSPVLSRAHARRAAGSYARYGGGAHLLSRATMELYWDLYLGAVGGEGGGKGGGGCVAAAPLRRGRPLYAQIRRPPPPALIWILGVLASRCHVAIHHSRHFTTHSVFVMDTAGEDWRASPLRAPAWRLRALPPTLVVYAKQEVVADEVEAFSARVAAAGGGGTDGGSSNDGGGSSGSGGGGGAQGPVTLRRYDATLHGFFAREGMSNGLDSLADTARFIRQHC